VKRYGLCNTGICEQPDGRYVLYGEAQAAIERLRAELILAYEKIKRLTSVSIGGVEDDEMDW